MTKLFEDFQKHILSSYGKDFSCYQADFFITCIENRMKQLATSDFYVYLDRLLQSSEELTILENSLKNHYSTFFRNPFHFFALEHYYLPRLILEKEQSGHKQIRVWSMACAFGQEAYSIAIIMDELLKKKNNGMDFRIFCTDQLSLCIEKAKKAQYLKEDIQSISLSRLERYFVVENSLYSIKPFLQEKLIFSCYDLLDGSSKAPADCIYNDFDLIFCCNVLYYYTPRHQERIMQKAIQNLNDHGILITDESEKDLVTSYTGWNSNLLTFPFFQKSTKEIR